ncbi:putative Trichodiene oxygenase [Glarea lozoyensis 74030]|uniref:Putative Trichodiene oxygenase n=1 Tax=Glarea lozoyensis (strain ATCC 74030 / MF5533) TaxID=1104152 RepID=H0EG32_GLAL7|nr:putative Trichodiene oxygenase [Glarea lozoyensis 74030]
MRRISNVYKEGDTGLRSSGCTSNTVRSTAGVLYFIENQTDQGRYIGPIVRISPWELHVNDPDWNEPYKVGSRVDKYHWYYKFVGSSDAAFGTSDHEKHRIRRKAQQGYFTLGAVAKFEPVLANITGKLCQRLQEFKETRQPVNLSNDIGVRTKEIVAAYMRGGTKQSSDAQVYERSNVIHQMLDSPELPVKDKTEFRLALEVRTFVGAGTETTGNTLVVMTYHLLANPDMAMKLKMELRAAQRASLKPLTYQQLAKLSYLSSVILEGHRRSCVGVHLASSELYVAIAKVFMELELELFDTFEDDIVQSIPCK